MSTFEGSRLNRRLVARLGRKDGYEEDEFELNETPEEREQRQKERDKRDSGGGGGDQEGRDGDGI